MIRYHYPPICKTCFSTSEWIWHTKKYFTKVLGFGKTPPHVGKNSQMILFFFRAYPTHIRKWKFYQLKKIFLIGHECIWEEQWFCFVLWEYLTSLLKFSEFKYSQNSCSCFFPSSSKYLSLIAGRRRSWGAAIVRVLRTSLLSTLR